jgi:anti-anti-sigma factor
VTAGETADGMVIRVKGVAGVKQSTALLSGLLAPAARRPSVVTLDLSDLRSISSLAMGALVTYRRGVVRTGGRVLLGHDLQPAVREALGRAGLLDLFDNAEAPKPLLPPGGADGLPASRSRNNPEVCPAGAKGR